VRAQVFLAAEQVYLAAEQDLLAEHLDGNVGCAFTPVFQRARGGDDFGEFRLTEIR